MSSLKRINKDEFKPMEFHLIIDSEDDLVELWNRLNIEPSKLDYGESAIPMRENSSCYEVFLEIDSACKKLGLHEY